MKRAFRDFIIFVTLWLIIQIPALAWHSSIHQVIAQIAYDQLSNTHKKKADYYTHIWKEFYHHDSFASIASWADRIKGHGVSAVDRWHYIDIGFSRTNWPIKPYFHANVVWAINQSLKVVVSKKANDFEKALFLRFLVHFVGDIHQPLHCAALFSKKFPDGDEAGNLFLINYPNLRADNLHFLWDAGFKRYPHGSRSIRRVAKKLEKKYPISKFSRQMRIDDPMIWAKRSYYLAKKYAYNISLGYRPNKAYLRRGRQITEQQIALAGYRLSKILNRHLVDFHS